ncbi:MAG: pyridoxal-dependent decarboxylase [Bacteroidetes bacterium]|nr:pyridoxal-dependent decarboxylase [Bacteroidota bacterium]
MEQLRSQTPAIPVNEEAFEFEETARRIIQWIAAYWTTPSKYPVFPQCQPGDIKKKLPTLPPQEGEPYECILNDFESIILPGITHWNHPGFMAYFGTTGSLPGVLGETLAAALNVNGMLWRTSPAATELEEVVLEWIRALLQLPKEFRGVLTDTASVSTLVALTAARESLGLHIREKGMAGRDNLGALRLYCSDQAHSSVEKAAIVLGIGQENVCKIPTDDEYRMVISALEQAVHNDRQRGYLPFAVVATAGTTATTSVDPLAAIAAICAREKLWLHVDAAYGGAAALLPEKRSLFQGLENADSVVFNPHKWMFTQSDCSTLFVRQPRILKQAFSLIPEYLKTDDGDVTNFMDWGIQLGRRFRALKLWFILRRYGVEGIRGMIREHCRIAQLLATWIDNTDDFERVAPTPFSVVCFRYHPVHVDDEQRLKQLNENLMQKLNESGDFFISSTILRGKYTLRAAVGNARTTEETVRNFWERTQEIARIHLR